MTYSTPSGILNVRDGTSRSSIFGITPGPEQSLPIIEEDLPETEIPPTSEKLDESGLDEHSQAILATYDKIGKFDLKKLQIEVLESGLPTFDKYKVLTRNQAKLITVGAHTSHGKSALLMQLAAHVSKTEPVIVHSFEMGSDEIETRLLAAIANIPSTLIQSGSNIQSKVDSAREDFASRKLYVSNVQNRSLNYVLSSIYEMSKIVGRPGLVVIDYGQQVKPGGAGARQTERVVEITDISAGLLGLAQQLKCNVVVGAQLNNEVLKRAYGSKDEDGNMEYIPIISDIREGSSIAHDSAVVLMVVRPQVFNHKCPKEEAVFYCLKNRHGELWKETLGWDGPKCMFYEEKKGPV